VLLQHRVCAELQVHHLERCPRTLRHSAHAQSIMLGLCTRSWRLLAAITHLSLLLLLLLLLLSTVLLLCNSSTKSHALPPSSPLTLSPVNLMSPTYTSSSTSSTQNGAVSGAGSTNSGSPYSQRQTPAHKHQQQHQQQQQAHGYMSPRTVAAAIAAIPAPGKPAAAWKMGSNGKFCENTLKTGSLNWL
jgi:hypothetical protein